MIKRLLESARRQPVVPVALLAAAGVLGGLALARAGGGTSPDAASRRTRRQLGALAGQTAGRVARAADLIDQGLESAREIAGESLRESARSAREGVRDGAGTLRDGFDSARDALPSRAPPSRLEGVRRGAESAGISEKAVVVFAATFLAKTLSGYLRWRGEDRARHRAEALPGAPAVVGGRSLGTPLEEHTVAELRRMASEQGIEGRSSMNKEELVVALESR